MTGGRLNARLDELAGSTPPERDRFVDFLRVFSIAVVVVWHWALSITHREDGALVMPNPLDVVPGGWLLTWVLQIMPLFFFVGGFANHAGWTSVRRKGGGSVEFLRTRARRLLLPPMAVVLAWGVWELGGYLLVDDHRSVLAWGTVVLMPFWFLGAYVWVVLLTPVTAAAHERRPYTTLLGLAVVIAAADVARFRAGLDAFGLLNSALVWVFAHQLGYLYRDGTLERLGTRGQATLAAAAAAALLLTTQLTVYPASMVATREVAFSHMWPTTAGIALVAVLQAGLAMLLRDPVSRWLRRPGVWKAVIAANAVVLTVFLWHMTAKVAFIGVYEALGFQLTDRATPQWWLERPLWLVGPALFLVPLVVLFAPVELHLRPSRRRARRHQD